MNRSLPIGILFAFSVSCFTPIAQADNTAVRKAAILQRLKDVPAGSVLIGQNIGHSNADAEQGYRDYVSQLKRTASHSPAMVGLDYGYDDIPLRLSSSNRSVTQFAKEGGMVTISMHPPNPWQRSRVNDTNIGDYDDLLRPGTLAYRRWRVYLDRVAEGLAELRDDGVVVLWRPMHEMNGGWFWWCPGESPKQWPTQEQYRALWRDMHTYFTVEKRLDHLLWVYAAAVQTSDQQKPVDYYYPGADVVDIVGLDWYLHDEEELERYENWRRLKALGKPIGITEFGPAEGARDGSFDATSALQVAERYTDIKFVMFWHSWPGNRMAIVDLKNHVELMNDPRVESLTSTDHGRP